MAKLPAASLPDWPAAMNQQLAAAYCGISVETFSAHCPVVPVVITSSNAGKRYLRVRLDEWLLSLDNPAPAKRQGMGALRLANREAQRA
ncbi:MAG TPA: hypothetical protein VIL30_18725 [Ramlibacter sp.]